MTFELNKKHSNPDFRELNAEETEMVSGGIEISGGVFAFIMFVLIVHIAFGIFSLVREIKKRK